MNGRKPEQLASLSSSELPGVGIPTSGPSLCACRHQRTRSEIGYGGTVGDGAGHDTTAETEVIMRNMALGPNVPSSIVDLIADLETEAASLRRSYANEQANLLRDVALRLRAAYEADADTMLDMDEAVDYSRGYNRDYLSSVLRNHGSRRRPQYRKGDVPRKAVRRR